MALRFDEPWSAWLRENIARGCADADLARDMVAAGFSPEESAARIAGMRGVHAEPPAPHFTPAFDGVNTLEFDGLTVSVSARLRDPSVAVLSNVITPSECAELIAQARSKMARSTTIDDATGQALVHAARTSDGGYFERDETELVGRLDRRFAGLMGIPHDHGEGLQVLCYGVGGEYRPHHDFFAPGTAGARRHMARGGQRVATMVVYLSDVEAGGETEFPQFGLSAAPRQGSAAYFSYVQRDGGPDPRLLHASSPVMRGEKWVATKWMRASAF